MVKNNNMDILKAVKNSILLESRNSYISKILYEKLSNKNFEIPDYLYVTEIINPAYSYYSRKVGEIEMPPEILSRMKGGESIHFMARQWFEQLPGFSGFEEIMNGSHLNLNVIGRADFMINNSIIEFKTKSSESINIDDLFNIYRSDLEQLLFYSVINKNPDRDNYLIFYSSSSKFYAFKIEIIDSKAIINTVRNRISIIKQSLSNDDPSILPRCSYYNYGCVFQKKNICTCDTLPQKDEEILKNAISVHEDNVMKDNLQKIYENNNDKEDLRYFDLIYPRKYYHRMRGDSEEAGTISTFNYDRKNITFFILDTIEKSILGIDGSERARKNETSMLDLYGNDKYIIKNIYDENSIVPFILKVNNSKYANNIPETYYSELAIICGRRNIKEGIIIVIYPKLDNEVVSYDITFDLSRIIDICKNKINDIKNAVKNGNPENLDLCPAFVINSCNFKHCSCKLEIMKK